MIQALLQETVAPHLAELARCRSAAELEAHPRYRSLEPALRRLLTTPEVGDFTATVAPPRPRYRILAWNVERGAQLDGQIEAFRSHPYLKTADVILLMETDLGMARSGNRDVARTLARELGLHYAFVPSYLNLTNGSGLERGIRGENTVGLQGNAVLSRYPIGSVRAIPLRNGIDKMASPEKRIGCLAALAAGIEFPNFPLTAVSTHLDAQSSQRHRRDQMRDILDGLPAGGPVLLGGDWNTTTYDSSRALWAILGFGLRVLMGVDSVMRNHYLHPYRLFEKELFAQLERRGFDYRASNLLGERTICYDQADPRTYAALRDWVPSWCFPFIRWSLRHHGGRCPFKIDWFAARGLRCENPVVIHDLGEDRAAPLSDHDAIGVEVIVPGQDHHGRVSHV